MRRLIIPLVGLLLLAACAKVSPTDAPAATAAPADAAPAEDTPVPTSTPIPTAGPGFLPEESPPRRAESEFSTDFARHTVPYSEILSGGPPKDGIRAIDEPTYVSVSEADLWLEPQEPVILVEIGGHARAYPIQIMTWHEIVNDTLGDVPVSVTFCPLCNTGVAFERTFDGQVLDFGTTGRLRYSNLIMYDRQTETWWQQATGEGIAGQYAGSQLTFVPASMIAWADFREGHPDGDVLSRDTGLRAAYGQNPYPGYDDVNESPFLYQGPATPGELPAMARVGTIDLGGEAVAYPYDVMRISRVVNDTVGGTPVVVMWAPGTASALDAGNVAGGEDVGAITTYARELDGEVLTFSAEGERIVDEQTGSEWDLLGKAVGGPLAGRTLEPVVSINHFWFSWAAFRPDTRIYQAQKSVAAEVTPTPEEEAFSLEGNFAINLYQGAEEMGEETVIFADVFAPGRPVVLSIWAGLCPVCRSELPSMQKAYEQYGDDVLIIGVDVGPFVGLGSKEDGMALLEEMGVTYPAGSTPNQSILRDYRILSTPATIFITPHGQVIDRWNGLLPWKQLEEKIIELLEASVAG